MTKTADIYLVEIDGSASPNPGPAGAGVKISKPDGSFNREISRYLGERTNNQAEYEALIIALEELLTISPDPRALIKTDSELVYYQLTGKYTVQNPDLRELHAKAVALFKRLPRVGFALVKDIEVRDAHDLAREAVKTKGNE